MKEVRKGEEGGRQQRGLGEGIGYRFQSLRKISNFTYRIDRYQGNPAWMPD
ncbi:hypothetical protein AALA79_19205 [Lachnospiraceae bacterium 64-25]